MSGGFSDKTRATTLEGFPRLYVSWMEAIRKGYPDEDWLHLTGLIHGNQLDIFLCQWSSIRLNEIYIKSLNSIWGLLMNDTDLGKVLLHPSFGELPQWTIVGDTFPVGLSDVLLMNAMCFSIQASENFLNGLLLRLSSSRYVFSASLPLYLASAAISAVDYLEENPSVLTALRSNIALLCKAVVDDFAIAEAVAEDHFSGSGVRGPS
ncbi:inositol oxygenase 1 isoform X1 [Canna indica]|uniref:Inositol oxygenase n=1 Tax=Canna indica TaxID=4628 RepID=A0AAQ3KSL8_9LILI|nr:inositol oxygenase 1 isoform X1 [Canna indica]